MALAMSSQSYSKQKADNIKKLDSSVLLHARVLKEKKQFTLTQHLAPDAFALSQSRGGQPRHSSRQLTLERPPRVFWS